MKSWPFVQSRIHLCTFLARVLYARLISSLDAVSDTPNLVYKLSERTLQLFNLILLLPFTNFWLTMVRQNSCNREVPDIINTLWIGRRKLDRNGSYAIGFSSTPLGNFKLVFSMDVLKVSPNVTTNTGEDQLQNAYLSELLSYSLDRLNKVYTFSFFILMFLNSLILLSSGVSINFYGN